jgi:hypothetical protein
MKHVLEARTDTATLSLFCPAALPADFDIRMQKDGPDSLWPLAKEGHFHCMNTGADGAYLLHLFEDEEVPDSMKPYVIDPVELPSFPVPTGQLYFTGAEYIFRNDDGELKKHPHMGTSTEVRAGLWKVTLFRTEYPDEMVEELVKRAVGERLYKLSESMGCLIGLAVLAVVSAGITYSFLQRRDWFVFVAPILFLALPFVLGRSRGFREAGIKRKEIEKQFPSIVGVMQWLAPYKF